MNRFGKIMSTVNRGKFWDEAFLRNSDLELIPGFDLERSPYTKSGLVYTCISLTSRAISQVPLRVLQQKKKQVWTPVDDDHPWQMKITKPNYLYDQGTFVEAIVVRLYLDGSVFVVAIPPTAKVPDSIWVIPKKNMIPIFNADKSALERWDYVPSTGKKTIPLYLNEVAHIKFFNPYDEIFGLSPLIAGKAAIALDYKSTIFNTNLLDNNAVPGGILSSEKKLSQPQRETLEKKIEDKHEGYRKSHRFMLLEGGMKFERIALNHQDMQFLELKKFTRDEIIQFLGMKKSVLSITENLNYAIHRGDVKEWWRSNNLPIIRLITSALNFTLLENDPNLKLAFDISQIEALQEDFTDKVTMAKDLYTIGFTANEINKKLQLGFDERKYRDNWYINIGQVPVNDENPIPPNPYAQPEKILLPPEQRALLPARKILDDEFDISSLTLEELRSLPIEKRVVIDKLFAKRLKNWRTHTNSLNPLEAKLSTHIKDTFYKMKKKSLDLLYKDTKEFSETPIKSLSLSEYKILEKNFNDLYHEEFEGEKDLLAKYAGGVYTSAVDKGIKSIESEIGASVSFDLRDPLALEFLELKPMMIRNVADTVKENSRAQVLEGMREGESIDQIADRLKDIFANASGRRNTIARTEVNSASNFGRYGAIKNSGFAKKEWFTAEDEKVRILHAAMDGESIGVDEVWVIDGFELKYPGDYDAPGYLAINCRCVEVVSGEPIGFEEDMINEEGSVDYGAGDLSRDQILSELNSLGFQQNITGDLLSIEEKEALKSYTGYGYDSINNYLRFGTGANSEITNEISILTSLLNKEEMRTNLNSVVYRGLFRTSKFNFSELSPGMIFEDKGFSSCSFSKAATSKFAGSEGWTLSVDVGKGAKALLTDRIFSDKTTEVELLLQRGSKFKIISIDRDIRFCKLELLI